MNLLLRHQTCHESAASATSPCVTFMVVQALDGALTYLGVHIWGPPIEANPIVSSAVSVAGVGTGLAPAKLFAVGLGMMLHLRRVHGVVAL